MHVTFRAKSLKNYGLDVIHLQPKIW